MIRRLVTRGFDRKTAKAIRKAWFVSPDIFAAVQSVYWEQTLSWRQCCTLAGAPDMFEAVTNGIITVKNAYTPNATIVVTFWSQREEERGN
jgi:hypothetical protein